MNNVINKTMNSIGNSLGTTIRLAASIAFASASLGMADANELGFGIVSIAPGQTARINAVLWESGQSGDSAPCVVELNFLDRNGSELQASSTVGVEPGQAIFQDIHFRAGLSVPEPPERGVRGVIKAFVDPNFVTDPTKADSCEVIGTLEVLDNETGKTNFVLAPGIIRGFSPLANSTKTWK